MSDYVQVQRSTALLLTASYAAYTTMLAGRILAQVVTVSAWFTPVAVALVLVGPAVVFGVAAYRGSARAVRVAVLITTVGYVIAVALWPVAYLGVPLAQSSWLSFVPGLAAMAAALVWRPAVALSYLLVLTVAAQSINQHRTAGANFAYPLELLYSFGFSLVFVAIVIEATRAGALLDRTRLSAQAAGAAAAAAEARLDQRRAHASAMHDWVLSTLLAANRLPDSDALRAQAVTALAKIETPVGGDAVEVSATRSAELIRCAIAEVSEVRLVVSMVHAQAVYPARVVDIIATGCAEAVRNTLRHNNSNVHAVAKLTCESNSVVATVTDSGIGFDPNTVSESRIGIRRSVAGLADIDGGSATITSRPGHGTTVRLAWHRPAVGDRGVVQFVGGRWRVAVAVVYLAGVCALAAMSAPITVGVVSALLLFALMTVVFVGYPGDLLPGPVATLAVLGPLGAWLVLITLPLDSTIEQLWPASATAAIYVALMLRGRAAAAWLGQIGVVGISVWCAAGIGLPAGMVLANRFADFAPLIGGAVFARIVRPRLHRTLWLRGESQRQAQRLAAAEGAAAEHHRQLTEFDATARELLTRLTIDRPLSTAERRECGELEAFLRDRLRGGPLAHPPLDERVRRARARGATVNLYDDRAGIPFAAHDWDRVVAAVVSELDEVVDATVTIRLPPADRAVLATMVVRGTSGTRRVTVTDREPYRSSATTEGKDGCAPLGF